MSEQYQNFAYGTISSTINNSSNPVTIVLNGGNGASFPATTNGPFRITVLGTGASTATEVMIVTTRSSDTLTAYRGTTISTYGAAEIPTPSLQAWAAGSVVSHNLTAGAMNQIRADINTVGSYATIPSTGLLGQRFIASDGVFGEYIYNGTTWVPYISGLPMSPPAASTFTTNVTAAGATQVVFGTQNGGALFFSGSRTSGGDNLIANMMTCPSTYTHRVRFYLNADLNNSPNYFMAGLCLWNSTSGKFETYCVGPESSAPYPGSLRVVTWNSGTSGNSTPYQETILPGRGGYYDLQISDNGTTRSFSFSNDGQNIFTGYSEATGSWITPTHVGVVLDPSGTGITPSMTILHWV
jgi:hypothetical protein